MADECFGIFDSWSSLIPAETQLLWPTSGGGGGAAFNHVDFDNEAITRALQASLGSEFSSFSQTIPSSSSNSEPDLDACSKRVRVPEPAPKIVVSSSSSGKIAKKRKSQRASKKSLTTYITADPASFREMVQQATGGVWFGGPDRPAAGSARAVQLLPTLDTSELLLRDTDTDTDTFSFTTTTTTTTPTTNSSTIYAFGNRSGSGSVLELETSCFPTLESWNGAM